MIISLFPVSSSCIDIKLLPTAIQNHTTVPLSIPNMAYKLLTRFFLSEDFGVTFSSSLYISILFDLSMALQYNYDRDSILTDE